MENRLADREFVSGNMTYYEYGRNVPQEAQKSFDNGKFKGTDINPMWRIRTLTEMFGPCGIGWYTEILSERSEKMEDGTVIAVVDLNLYVKVDGEWSKPIYGTGGNKLVAVTRSGKAVSDEGYKMAYTDALSVACKALGIGANIYWSADKTKYTMADEQRKAQAADITNAAKAQQTLTAVVDSNWIYTSGCVVPQDELTRIGAAYIRTLAPDQKLAVSNEIKGLNNGSNNYKDVQDAETRRKLYIYFYNRMNPTEQIVE